MGGNQSQYISTLIWSAPIGTIVGNIFEDFQTITIQEQTA